MTTCRSFVGQCCEFHSRRSKNFTLSPKLRLNFDNKGDRSNADARQCIYRIRRVARWRVESLSSRALLTRRRGRSGEAGAVVARGAAGEGRHCAHQGPAARLRAHRRAADRLRAWCAASPSRCVLQLGDLTDADLKLCRVVGDGAALRQQVRVGGRRQRPETHRLYWL